MDALAARYGRACHLQSYLDGKHAFKVQEREQELLRAVLIFVEQNAHHDQY